MRCQYQRQACRCMRARRTLLSNHAIKRLRLQSRMVVAVRSSGISGHDSTWPRRVMSGDSALAGGEGLKNFQVLRVFDASRSLLISTSW